MKISDAFATPGVMLASVFFLFVIDSAESASAMADVVTVAVESTSGNSQSNVPVTFGQVFAPGALIDARVLGARGENGSELPLQVNAKATHADGSLRHAILTMILPSLDGNAEEDIIIFDGSNRTTDPSITMSQLLATSFDANLQVNVGGTLYTVSARDLLTDGNVDNWLSGPLVSEWLVSGPVVSAGGAPHPHLSARFHVRAYAGLEAVRVSLTLENAFALGTGHQNFVYDAIVTIDGRGTVLSQENVTHYRQARWRRVFWWGDEPAVHVAHDTAYIQRTAAVPTYDPDVRVPGSVLSTMASDSQGPQSQLMGAGAISTYMPSGGARDDIGPLPRWTAIYLITQDPRAKTAMLLNGEQAGSFDVHYRDEDTDLPISLDTYPNLTILGVGGIFPDCAGDCDSPLVADVAHQPSLSFVPYLVSGDYFHLEELQFWANWNLYYWGDHGGSSGLMVNDQIRAQAWGLRTVGHAAYITPDDHPLKSYFSAKLKNNLDWYTENVSSRPPTPLGYMLNPPSLQQDRAFATWMDDFFTWTVGHLANLGFSDARPIFDYKSVFPVGRMTQQDYCWILASTYWTRARDEQTGQAFSTWSDYKAAVISSWDDDSAGPSFNNTAPAMRSDLEDDLLAASCDSSQMASILGLSRGQMIGYASSPEGYPSNLQPALAVAVERAVPDADLAWSTFDARSIKPDSGSYSYDGHPQWAIVPGDIESGEPTNPLPLPAISLFANPAMISENSATVLTWSTTNATSCTAQGGWTGTRPVVGNEEVGPLSVTTTYDMACANSSGTVNASTTVSVVAADVLAVSLSASADTVSSGSNVILTWTSQNADACSAAGGWSGNKATTGNESVGPVDQNLNFTLTCTGNAGSASDSVSVAVSGSTASPPPAINSGSGSLGIVGVLGLNAILFLRFGRRIRVARECSRG